MADEIAAGLRQLAEKFSQALSTLDGLSDADRGREWLRQLGVNRDVPPLPDDLVALILELTPNPDAKPAVATWSRLVASLARLVAKSGTPWSLIITADGHKLEVGEGRAVTLATSGGAADGFTMTIGRSETRIESGPLAIRSGALVLTGVFTEPASLAIHLAPLSASGPSLEITLNGLDYLAPFFGGRELRVGTTIGATLDNDSEFRFRGGDRSALELPVAASPSLVRDVSVSLASLADAEDAFGVELSFMASLGPFDCVFHRLTIPFSTGEVTLSPPAGIGLRTSTPPMRGGGFLLLDIARGHYAGAVELQLGTLAIRAVGILTTQPFSLLIVLRVEFVPAIELGLGFTLNAVGGLIAANRTIDRDAFVRAGFDGSLVSALFPDDPVADAPALLEALSRIFPQADDQVIVGPSLRLGWGRPISWVTADLAVVIQIPDARIAIVGQFRIAVPHQDAPLVDLRADVFGLIDPSVGIDFGGVLRSSRIGPFAVEGGMGLRIHPGEREGFILSVGGFNGKYQPLPGFIGPPRVSIQISDTPLLRMRFTGYVALTSGTFQIGAGLDIQVGIDDFGARATLGFDGFLQWEPHFAFSAQLFGSVSITAFGQTLMGASLSFLLEGPEPCWHARGQATLSTFLFDVEIEFDEHWACSPPRPIPAPDVVKLLVAQLERPENWFIQPPEGQRAVVVRSNGDDAAMVMHPEGVLRFSQRLVPLDHALTRFGGAQLTAPTSFGVDVRLGDAPPAGIPLFETFPRAQFINLTNEERLSGPGFERYKSGVEIAADAVKQGESLEVGQRYETFVFETPGEEGVRLSGRRHPLEWTSALTALEASAAAHSPVHAARRFTASAAHVAIAPPQITTAAKRFEARSIRDLRAAALPGLDAAQTLDEARSILDSHARLNPTAFDNLRLVDLNPTGQR
jgi:hypothetical protein